MLLALSFSRSIKCTLWAKRTDAWRRWFAVQALFKPTSELWLDPSRANWKRCSACGGRGTAESRHQMRLDAPLGTPVGIFRRQRFVILAFLAGEDCRIYNADSPWIQRADFLSSTPPSNKPTSLWLPLEPVNMVRNPLPISNCRY